MILEPNRRRRRRAFRALVGVVVVLFIGGLLATGWTPPAFSIAVATSTAPAASPTNTVAVVPTGAASPEPTASPPPPSPAPTPDAHGCLPAPAELVPAIVASHGPRTERVVALTFDDGNNAGNVARIREFLISHRVNATFFPTARAVELAPETWQRVAQAGFPIGNHTYHHQSLKALCFAAQLAELEKAKNVIGAHGLAIQPYMRPPFEDYSRDTQLAARAAGEDYVVLWNIDTLDWTGLNSRAIARRAIGYGPGALILMHTSSASTTAALLQVVAHYRKRGFTFITVGQMLGIPGPVPFP